MREQAEKLAEKIRHTKPGTTERQEAGYEALRMIGKARQSLPIEAAKEISVLLLDALRESV